MAFCSPGRRARPGSRGRLNIGTAAGGITTFENQINFSVNNTSADFGGSAAINFQQNGVGFADMFGGVNGIGGYNGCFFFAGAPPANFPGLYVSVNSDSHYRCTMSLDASDRPILAFGSGAATEDVGISRSTVGVVAFGNSNWGDASATIKAKTTAGAPSTTDVPAGAWALIRDTTNNTTKLYYNNAGTLQSVALA